MIYIRVLLGLMLVALLFAGDAAAAARLALVIGNSSYADVPPLKNPANDAHDFAAKLRTLGFDVIEQIDANRDGMARAVSDFSDRLPQAELALFYYAGHGLQMNGENYLIAVDAKIKTAADVRFNTINLSDIEKEMESAGRTNILILDACRNNPFADKLTQSGRALATRGLARLDAAGRGSLVVYSTQPDNVAFDGAGRNSPFTEALLKNVSTPGLEVRQMLSHVRGDVLAATEQKQTPWDSSSLVADIYLAGDPAKGPAPTSALVTPGPALVAPLPAATAPAATSSTARDAVSADDSVDAQCDKLAALHLDYTGPAAMREKTPQDWPRALVVCQAASQAHPDELHYLYQLARAQDKTRDYFSALKSYKRVAESGFTEAYYDIGVAYYYGHGVLQSFTMSLNYLNMAAEGGSIRALGGLGAMYGEGKGAPKDDAKALDYAGKAVEAGNPFGLKVISDHYFNGAGVQRDFQMCAQYLQQAIDLGNGLAMKALANMYAGGYLGAPDINKANELRLRAQQEDPGSAEATPLPPYRAVNASYGATASSHTGGGAYVAHRRRYVVYHYNPVWQAAPGDNRCCPNNMLVCPLGRHFCGH